MEPFRVLRREDGDTQSSSTAPLSQPAPQNPRPRRFSGSWGPPAHQVSDTSLTPHAPEGNAVATPFSASPRPSAPPSHHGGNSPLRGIYCYSDAPGEPREGEGASAELAQMRAMLAQRV